MKITNDFSEIKKQKIQNILKIFGKKFKFFNGELFLIFIHNDGKGKIFRIDEVILPEKRRGFEELPLPNSIHGFR